MNCITAKKIALDIIQSFPKNKNGKPFLTLKNKQKLFFNIFIKKYGIDGSSSKYSDSDILRRIRLIECFDFLTKQYEMKSDRFEKSTHYSTILTKFFKFVIIQKKNKSLECLSFYQR